ncbi:hypothetical protein DB346_02800 [Verrucomicrobia bacterium LW23]|nr:hypothetical protein DB346_03855 [Verrucomicrobia bacterium LW23]PTY04377.1 hypothetical protein DB346_02800 [Verrucomicrobia bacterium LW23]
MTKFTVSPWTDRGRLLGVELSAEEQDISIKISAELRLRRLEVAGCSMTQEQILTVLRDAFPAAQQALQDMDRITKEERIRRLREIIQDSEDRIQADSACLARNKAALEEELK